MNCRILVSFTVSCFAACVVQAQVHAPKVGVARYADSTVRAVYGVESAFVVDRQAIGSADAISFSDFGGLLSSNGHIKLLDAGFSLIAEYDSGEKAPLLDIEDLKSAIAWLPSQQALLRWTGASFVLTRLNAAVLDGVSSVRVAGPTSAKLLISQGDSVFEALISLDTGDVISMTPLPGVQAPAFSQDSFVLFLDPNGLQIQSRGGALRTIALHASDLTFERMSSDWLHLSSAATGQNWALHLNGQAAQLSELPGSPVESPGLPARQLQEATK